MPPTSKKATKDSNGATLGFEAKLWAAADALRNNMDAAEYKHVVLGLIFLKYISDAFEAKHAELDSQREQGADPEDQDEYRAASIFFLARNKRNGRFRDRRGETLFINAGELGTMVDRVHRELTAEDTARIAGTYHAWRGDKDAGEYADVPGFCKAARLDDIRKRGHVLTPGRYVGAEAAEEDDEPFDAKMNRLAATLRQQQGEATKLDAAIAANLKELGYGE